MTDVRDRIQRNVIIDAEGCWLWQLHCDPDGYGRIHWKGGSRSAHRTSYEVFVGPIPAGLVIDHLCGVPGCVNPEHLEAVTTAENTRRSTALQSLVASALARTECRKGHPYLPDNVRINSRGARVCVTCAREAGRKSSARRRAVMTCS